MKVATGGEILPASQLSTMQAFSGIIEGGRELGELDWGQYWSSPGGFSRPAELANYVSPAVSIFAWLAIFAGALCVALWAMERKEVH